MTRKQKTTDYTSVKPNDLMALVYFVKVDAVGTSPRKGNPAIDVTDVETNMEFTVEGKDVIEKMYSADRFLEEKKVTQTEIAEQLISSHNVPFTVVFEKASGEERTLRGKLLEPEPLMGRSKVEDLDVTSGIRMRLVDHRTIKSLIVNGTKYSLKK